MITQQHRMTIADRMDAAGGHPRGFDYMRLALAVSVLAFHSFTATHDLAADHEMWRSPLRALLRPILPMFFALGGFLVAGSLFRCATLIEFGVLRALRIMPALLVEIMLSALILGPLLTEFTLQQYFTSRQFYSYFLNLVGDIHFALPGLFLDNPRPRMVNGSLWTLYYEFLGYGALAAFALGGIIYRRRLLLMAIAATLLAIAAWLTHAGGILYAPPGMFLVACFLTGIAFYTYRHRLPHDRRLFILAAAAGIFFLYYDPFFLLSVFPLTYATVYLGVTHPGKTILLRGDYSYGIYLFAYPIQQASVMLLPGLNTLGCFLIAMPVSFAYAIFSWHCIEGPILRKKSAVTARIARLMSWRAAAAPKSAR